MRFKASLKSFILSILLLTTSIYAAWNNKEDFYSITNTINSGKIFLEDGRTIYEGILFQTNILIPCTLFAAGVVYLFISIWLLIRPGLQHDESKK
jgi:hypothetical protein